MVQRYKVKGDDKRDLILECQGGETWTVLKGGSAWSLKNKSTSIESETCRNVHRVTFDVRGEECVMAIHPDLSVVIGVHRGILTSL